MQFEPGTLSHQFPFILIATTSAPPYRVPGTLSPLASTVTSPCTIKSYLRCLAIQDGRIKVSTTT